MEGDAEGADEAIAGDLALDLVQAWACSGAGVPGIVQGFGGWGELGRGEEAEAVHDWVCFVGLGSEGS